MNKNPEDPFPQLRRNFNSRRFPDLAGYFSPLSGSHADARMAFCSDQRRRVRTERRVCDWPLPGVRGGHRCHLVSPVPVPSGRTHHAQRPARLPGPDRFGEGGRQSKPERTGGGGAGRHREWHQDGDAGGRLKEAGCIAVSSTEYRKRKKKACWYASGFYRNVISEKKRPNPCEFNPEIPPNPYLQPPTCSATLLFITIIIILAVIVISHKLQP